MQGLLLKYGTVKSILAPTANQQLGSAAKCIISFHIQSGLLH